MKGRMDGGKNSKMISNQFVEIVSMISPELLYSVYEYRTVCGKLNQDKERR